MRISFATLQVIAEECQDYKAALAALEEPHCFYGIWSYKGRIMCRGNFERCKKGKQSLFSFTWEE